MGKKPSGELIMSDVQERYDNGEFTWEDGFTGKVRMIWTLLTLWGHSLMNTDKDNPTAEVMAGEEGRRG